MIRCVACKIHPEETWDSTVFDGLLGLPWDPGAKRNMEATEVEPAKELPRLVVEREIGPMVHQTRQIKLTQDIFRKVGFSDNCGKCRLIVLGDTSAKRANMSHSAACRKRVEEKMAADPFLKGKLDIARQREDEYLARRVELGDLSAKRARESSVEEAQVDEEMNNEPATTSVQPEGG